MRYTLFLGLLFISLNSFAGQFYTVYCPTHTFKHITNTCPVHEDWCTATGKEVTVSEGCTYEED